MAFGRLERSPLARPMSDINMTPLIDVMLVLLVIFMIAAPLMTSSLKLELPSSRSAAPTEAPRTLELAVDAEGRLFLGDQALERDALAQKAAAAARADPRTEVLLRADKRVPYGAVADLIDLVQQAGLTRIGFVTETGR